MMTDARLDAGFIYGYELAAQADFAQLERMSVALRSGAPRGQSDFPVLLGACVQFALICEVAATKGAKFAVPVPSKAAYMHMLAGRQWGEFLSASDQLIASAKALRAAGWTWTQPTTTAGSKAAPPAPAPQQPQEFRIVSMPPVQISALPDRKTETTVRRDAEGDISGSTTVERDAA
jgi:hypothetical protein